MARDFNARNVVSSYSSVVMRGLIAAGASAIASLDASAIASAVASAIAVVSLRTSSPNLSAKAAYLPRAGGAKVSAKRF